MYYYVIFHLIISLHRVMYYIIEGYHILSGSAAIFYDMDTSQNLQ